MALENYLGQPDPEIDGRVMRRKLLEIGRYYPALPQEFYHLSRALAKRLPNVVTPNGFIIAADMALRSLEPLYEEKEIDAIRCWRRATAMAISHFALQTAPIELTERVVDLYGV